MNRSIAGVLAALLVGCPKPVDPGPGLQDAPRARGQLPTEAGLPPRPEAIEAPPLSFDAPKAADFRSELAGGIPMFHAQSTELPLVEVQLYFKGGSYLDPDGHDGLGSAVGALMRSGGTASRTPEALDEELDFLAAQASVSVGTELSSARVNCLKDTLDPCLDLFVEMVRSPRFDANRLKVWKDGRLEQMLQRNDDARDIVSREWDALMWGRDHYLGSVPTKADLDAIDKADLTALHGRIFQPGEMIVAVSGDVSRDVIARALESRFAGWAKGPALPGPPAPTHVPEPGLYHVQKDIPQGKVRFGMRGITRDDPDELAVRVMNDILGGGGFTSRITKKVRSDEGLAYGARSAFFTRVEFPGELRVWTESKNETVALATKLMWDEVARIRTEPVTDGELETTKASMIETFPRTFESRTAMVSLFANDELTGRPADHWSTWRDRVSAVTAADVQRVADAHIDLSKMVVLIVGDWDAIKDGDLGKRASMMDFYGGKVKHLPLRDPLTQAPLE